MLKSLLVASDLSKRSAVAVERAVQLSGLAQAQLTVLHVVEDDLLGHVMRDEIKTVERSLGDQVAQLAQQIDCRIKVAAGHAFHVIGEEARSVEADLLIMGAHRRQFLRDIFTGTTIERVTRSAGCPVLMANASPADRWRRVFIAKDLSETSGHAARTALSLGLLDGADVTFIHGFAPITRQMMTHAGIPADRVHEEAERDFESARRALARFILDLDLGDLNYNARIIEGVGADAIAGFVSQAKPDLLVIGTRGLSGVKRLFLGSVAQDLMGSLEIDILAVPPKA
jgi:nucleotide-binding universal stress UspA family protein